MRAQEQVLKWKCNGSETLLHMIFYKVFFVVVVFVALLMIIFCLAVILRLMGAIHFLYFNKHFVNLLTMILFLHYVSPKGPNRGFHKSSNLVSGFLC